MRRGRGSGIRSHFCLQLPLLFLQSKIPNPKSEAHSPQFPECEGISDTLLAKIAAGTECLVAIAAFHNIPYPRFTLWLLEPSTQQRLAALSVAIASAARLTATATLPDIVRGLKTTVDQLQSQTHMTIAPPGANHLLAESIILRRHRALISAASLIYRISRFTCPAPANQRTDVPPRSALGPRCSSREREHPAATRRGLHPLPKLELPAIDFPDPDPRPAAAAPLTSRNPDPGTRNPIPAFTSDIRHPTSDITTISVDDALRILTAEYDLTAEEVAELRDSSHSWIRDFIPPSAPKTPATFRASPAADDG